MRWDLKREGVNKCLGGRKIENSRTSIVARHTLLSLLGGCLLLRGGLGLAGGGSLGHIEIWVVFVMKAIN